MFPQVPMGPCNACLTKPELPYTRADMTHANSRPRTHRQMHTWRGAYPHASHSTLLTEPSQATLCHTEGSTNSRGFLQSWKMDINKNSFPNHNWTRCRKRDFRSLSSKWDVYQPFLQTSGSYAQVATGSQYEPEARDDAKETVSSRHNRTDTHVNTHRL